MTNEASRTLRDAVQAASRMLADAVGESARLEAEILVAHAIDADRSVLFSRPETVLPPDANERIDELIKRRRAGWPVAYLLGHREFRSLSLLVTPDVLIPRHDTELLVELALRHIPEGKRTCVLDLGTGSGAIALSIAHARRKAEVVATDASDSALTVACMNARSLAIDNVRFLQGDWYAPITGERFDVIASNPPYIAVGDRHLGEGDCRFEPAIALASGEDGLDAIREIAAGAPKHLEAGGVLLVEHGSEQGAAVREIFERAGFVEIETALDVEARERVTSGKLLPEL